MIGKGNVNRNEEILLIATEYDSSIDSDSLAMNDNLSNSITKQQKMSTVDLYLGELHLFYFPAILI